MSTTENELDLTAETPENVATLHSIWEARQNDPEYIARRELLARYEATDDDDFILDTLHELEDLDDIKTNSDEASILNSIARNWGISSEAVDMVADLDDRYGLDISFHLAGNENLTRGQQLRFARHADSSVRWCLAHSRHTPAEVLELLAVTENDADVLKEILNNRSCTPEVRTHIHPELVEEFDTALAVEVTEVSEYEEYDERWGGFEPHMSACLDLAAVLNRNLPEHLAHEYVASGGFLSPVVIARQEADAYDCPHYLLRLRQCVRTSPWTLPTYKNVKGCLPPQPFD